MILTEPARPAGAGGEIEVFLRDLLRARFLDFLLQEVEQVSGREARRAALADIGDGPAGQQVGLCRRRENLRFVAKPRERALDKAFSTPVQSAIKNRDVLTLFPGEGPRLVGSEVLGRCARHV